jgi:iron complex transport system permease protein
MTEVLTAKSMCTKILICLLILAIVMGICAMTGSGKISLKKALQKPSEDYQINPDRQILFGVRIPRVILAALVGAALACSGAVLQAILRNPLADPYILGISSGAGLGVIIAVLAGITWQLGHSWALTVFAFSGALATVWLVWWIGSFTGKGRMTSLLLAGVVVNAFFSAVMMFLISIAKSHQLRATTLWLMGNITEKPMEQLTLGAFLIISAIAGLFMISRNLNVITFGQQEAHSLGVDPERTRFIAFSLSALATSIAVGLSGLIGFVGLIVPHAVRLIFGPDHRQLIVISALTGAGFVVIADTIARTIVAPEQLPVGVITAIAGGPFFLVLLIKYSRKVSWSK